MEASTASTFLSYLQLIVGSLLAPLLPPSHPRQLHPASSSHLLTGKNDLLHSPEFVTGFKSVVMREAYMYLHDHISLGFAMSLRPMYHANPQHIITKEHNSRASIRIKEDTSSSLNNFDQISTQLHNLPSQLAIYLPVFRIKEGNGFSSFRFGGISLRSPSMTSLQFSEALELILEWPVTIVSSTDEVNRMAAKEDVQETFIYIKPMDSVFPLSFLVPHHSKSGGSSSLEDSRSSGKSLAILSEEGDSEIEDLCEDMMDSCSLFPSCNNASSWAPEGLIGYRVENNGRSDDDDDDMCEESVEVVDLQSDWIS